MKKIMFLLHKEQRASPTPPKEGLIKAYGTLINGFSNVDKYGYSFLCADLWK